VTEKVLRSQGKPEELRRLQHGIATPHRSREMPPAENAADPAPPVGQRCPLEGVTHHRCGAGVGKVLPGAGGSYFFQKRAVNTTNTDSNSSRPSSIAKLSTHI
jgi:hypothetical protein